MWQPIDFLIVFTGLLLLAAVILLAGRQQAQHPLDSDRDEQTTRRENDRARYGLK